MERSPCQTRQSTHFPPVLSDQSGPLEQWARFTTNPSSKNRFAESQSPNNWKITMNHRYYLLLAISILRVYFSTPGVLGFELPNQLVNQRVVFCARHSGMSMDIEGGAAQKALIQTAGMGGQQNREWKIIPTLIEENTIWYRIVDSTDKFQWDIRDAGYEGALLQVATPGEGPVQSNRLFKFDRLDNGFYLISAKHSGFSLDVVGAGGFKAKIQTHPGHGGLRNREWEVIPVDLPIAMDLDILGKQANFWRIAIRAWTGYNLCGDDTLPMLANREWANISEQFDLFHVGEGYFAIRSHRNGKWLRFDDNQVAATSAAVGEYEKFELIFSPDGTHSMKLKRNGRFLTTEGNTGKLTANRDQIGDCEHFKFDLKTAYDPPFAPPAGVKKDWVESGDFRKLAFGVGTGINFSIFILAAPIDTKARAQYFITPNGDIQTFSNDPLKINVSGLYGEVAVQPPYACYVYFSSSGIQLIPAAAKIGPIKIKF